MYQVEICCGSYQDAQAAYHGGARRIELNSALSVGGLTPSLTVLRRIKKEMDLKVICMVRIRAGGFCFDSMDIELMMEQAMVLLEAGADGIAFGFLTKEGDIDYKSTKKMTDLIHAYHKEAVFHRAIDVTKDIDQAMMDLISCGIDRVLTSGQKEKAMEGIHTIARLQKLFGEKIEILAGSGMNALNAREMLMTTGIQQIHSSCKSFKKDPTTQRGNVSYAYLSAPHEMDYDIVDEDLVKKLVEAVS